MQKNQLSQQQQQQQQSQKESYIQQYEFLEQLSTQHQFTEDLEFLLINIKDNIQNEFWDNFTNRITLYLVQLTCQTKQQQYEKQKVVNNNNINSQQNGGNSKDIFQRCIDLITELLVKIAKYKQGGCEKMCELFLEHQETHLQCIGSLSIFYKIVFFSETMIKYIRQNYIFQNILEIFEKSVSKLLKEGRVEERQQLINQTLRNPNTFCDNNDFNTQLSRYVQTNFPQAYKNLQDDKQTTTININSPSNQKHSEFESIYNMPSDKPSQIQNELTISTENNERNLRNQKVPLLNFNPISSTSEAGFCTLTRSTRREKDPVISFSTNSNRNSIDSGLIKENRNFQLRNFHEVQNLQIQTLNIPNQHINSNNIQMSNTIKVNNNNANINNQSIQDIDYSYLNDDKEEHKQSNISCMDKMKNLARQLGEYNLTVDLSCLLSQKRKQQLDQVAKIACFQEVDSLMDLKIDENFIKDKIQKKKKNNRSQKMQSHQKGNALNNHNLEQITLLEFQDMKEISASQESLLITTTREHQMSQQDQQQKQFVQLNQQQIKKLKIKTEIAILRKKSRILANLMYIIMKDMPSDKIQLLSSPINIIYVYLSSDLHMRIRKKDLMKIVCSRKVSREYQDIENEFEKLYTVCEGLDNVDGINRHYEKIKIDLYKAKLLHSQQSILGSQQQNFQIDQELMHQFDTNQTFDNISFYMTHENETDGEEDDEDDNCSSEEFSISGKNLNLDHLLLQENVVYYKILNQYAICSEKMHETLSLRKGLVQYCFNNSNQDLIFNQNEDNEKKLLGNLKTQRKFNKNMDILLKGMKIDLETINPLDIKQKSNQFLFRFQKKFLWNLNNVDINNDFYFDIQCEQLDILDSYLQHNSSRIICYEVIDNVLEIFLMLKRQFVELSLIPNAGFQKSHQQSVRVQTPLPNKKSSMKSSINTSYQQNQFQSQNPFYTPSGSSTNQPNNISNFNNNNLNKQQQQQFKQIKTGESPSKYQQTSSQQQIYNEEQNKFSTIQTQINLNSNQPFILKQKDIFGLYLSCLARIIIKSPRQEIYKMLNSIYFTNPQWRELIKMYSIGLINEILIYCNDKVEVQFSHDKISLFLNAQRLLFYFKSLLIMCQTLIKKEKLNEKKKEKVHQSQVMIKKIIQDFYFLIKPENGIICKFLQANQSINTAIITASDDKLPILLLLRINLYKEVFQFLYLVFSFNNNFSVLLQEDIVSYYLKYSFVNFVKLYSHSNINELNEISNKIKEANSRKNQEDFKENIKEILDKVNEEPSKLDKYYKYFKLNILNSYIKLLFMLSTVRTEEITKKFYKYRIVEFLTREIDLEFDITQIRQRFLRIRKEVKQQQQDQQQQQQQQFYTAQNSNHSNKNSSHNNTNFYQQQDCSNSSKDRNSEHKQQSLSAKEEKQSFFKGNNKIPILNLSKKEGLFSNPNKLFMNQTANSHFQNNFEYDEFDSNNFVNENNNNISIQPTPSQIQQQNQQQSITNSKNPNNKQNNNTNTTTNNKRASIPKFQQGQVMPVKQNQQEDLSQNKPVKQEINIPQKPPIQQQSQQGHKRYASDIEHHHNNSQNNSIQVSNNNNNVNQSKQSQQQKNIDEVNKQPEIKQIEEKIKEQYSSSSSDDEYYRLQILARQEEEQNKKLKIPMLKLNTNSNSVSNHNNFQNQNNININQNNEINKKQSDQNQNNHSGSQQKHQQQPELQQSQQIEQKQIPLLNLNQGQDESTQKQQQPHIQIQNQNQNSQKPKIPGLKIDQMTQNMNIQNQQQQKIIKTTVEQNMTEEEKQQSEMSKSNFKMQLVIDKKKIQREQMNLHSIQEHIEKVQNSKQQQQNNNNIQQNKNFYFAENSNMKIHHTQQTASIEPELNVEDLLNENIFYYSERRLRKIYQDEELHSYVIALLISLLLTPQRGTLDETYCSQNPILEGKPNILFLLHFHLNHPSNLHILPFILEKVCYIKPYPAGQRMIKLLSTTFTDVSMYSNWQKINQGAYGIIFEAKTNLPEPQSVAIKQMTVPTDIYSRCVLHDIFTEITCLENFRLDPCVTDLYDYGVTKTDYLIIMKKYPISLKDWRLKQKGTWQDNLPTYLTLYKDILKAVQQLHSNNIVHYDLKADNILLDNKSNALLGENNLKIVLGDFGECRMFTGENDEYCLQSRGTEYIKSPEMLTLAISTKKEGDKYDRRKKVGTTRCSDVWSLGCLLYEILTGEFLFYHPEWAQFYTLLTSPNENLLPNDKLEKIGFNTYVIDFLKFLFIREQNLRPNLDNVLKRFEHIHALLVSSTNPLTTYSAVLINSSNQQQPFTGNFENLLESYQQLMFQPIQVDIEKFNLVQNFRHKPTYLKILEEIFLCNKSYFLQNKDRISNQDITHIVTETDVIELSQLNRFQYLYIMQNSNGANKVHFKDQNEYSQLFTAPFRLAPRVIDFIREVFLYRGKILFIEDDNINLNSGPKDLLIRNVLLFCLTYFFKCSVYETLTLINSQYLDSYPKSQCICGCTTFVLKRNFSTEKKINIKLCSCTRENNLKEINDCPGDGCAEYLSFIRNRYKLRWESLQWAYLNPSQFFIGPFNSGQISDEIQIQLIQCSEGPTYNCVPHKSMTDKQEDLFYQLTENEWTVYKCKVCHMWMFALNSKDSTIAFILNNLIKRNRYGIMVPNQKQNYKIKTPVLRHFNLFELK